MAAEEHQSHHLQQELNDHHHYGKLLSSYLGLSFTLFLEFIPKNSINLLSDLQIKNKALSFKLKKAEEQLKQLQTRRKEDSKANARVVEIFASHRHSWQQEEKRLLQQIDEGNEEISCLKRKVEDFERLEDEMKANIEDLKREICERDEMLNFMSSDEKRGFYGENLSGLSSDFLNSAASKLWAEKGGSWQDVQYQSLESVYPSKHFVARMAALISIAEGNQSPWTIDGDPTGVSSKLKVLAQELSNFERVDEANLSKVQSQMRKQAKRYQALAAKIDDLCGRMKARDPNEATISSEFRTQRQAEFLLEAFRLQQRAAETYRKLMELQKSYRREEIEGKAKLAAKRSLDSIRNSFKEIQRNLEIWLARIVGDLEGILARDGASYVRDYHVSRYPFVQ
ncbi:hypothetical protein CDL12_08722 [Handroanthus impetiginosus]|uniref:Uncharacterized protein n=1 Tax=Handroanthus impetiginosus TaxID=429701 RepID=A0A2G9HM49_9LAMI|nr:hypothetical protein CDL12_08722 [Handroanthus impetiginosus]